ncbi:hypothetical protein SDRG_13190 [Saprolegnia diclina VS20]|uniref:Ubiquitin-like protease family profile domain-containing protein n=1 Tax=Saprolegnia diclina (strain VS20) TaxID=1156394 RepID=T0PU55_SAPDV|nr:hypothetical protein SDRG_13190 [Saprolegnia diclina VS20]EQC29034.1 hypothetical protein SDRG_13190 [Saprolegnia diclina VS20]|eukprot:XP_008617493.1 hypothetical protein SDRG_13190 [Saprolegnia diclina VS20]
MDDRIDGDVPAWQPASAGKLRPDLLETMDLLDTPEKASKKRYGLASRSTTTTTIASHIPRSMTYEPLTRKKISTRPPPDTEDAKRKKRDRRWDNEAPTTSFDQTPSKPDRPFYSVTKAVVKPRLPMEPASRQRSKTVPSRIVPGQAIMGSSTNSTAPKYSGKISGSLAEYATKPAMRPVFSTTTTSSVLERATAGHYASMEDQLKADTRPKKRPCLDNKPKAAAPMDEWRSKAHKTSVLYERRRPAVASFASPNHLPTVKPYSSTRAATKSSGSADKPISFSSDEDEDGEDAEATSSPMVDEPTLLACVSLNIGANEMPPTELRLETQRLSWSDSQLYVSQIAQLLMFASMKPDVPSFLAISATRNNVFRLDATKFIVAIPRDPDALLSFFNAFKRRFPHVVAKKILLAGQAQKYLVDVAAWRDGATPRRSESQLLRSATLGSKLHVASLPPPPTTTTTTKPRKTRQSGRRPRVASKVVVVYPLPPANLDVISITEEDLDRLEPEVYLNDNLIDFYFKWLQAGPCTSTKPYCLCFGALFFPALTTGGSVASWYSYDDLFSKEVVVVPINIRNHWSLVVIFNLGMAALPKADRRLPPVLTLLDSMSGAHRRGEVWSPLLAYLGAVFKKKHGTEDGWDPSAFARFAVKSPQQINSFDCGVHMLLSAHMLLDAYDSLRGQRTDFGVDDSMVEAKLSNLIRSDTYDAATVEATRTSMRTNLDDLARQYEQIKINATKTPSTELEQLSISSVEEASSETDIAEKAAATTDDGDDDKVAATTGDDDDDEMASTAVAEDQQEESQIDALPNAMESPESQDSETEKMTPEPANTPDVISDALSPAAVSPASTADNHVTIDDDDDEDEDEDTTSVTNV